MNNNRPVGREKNVTGRGHDLSRRGSGLGTGPVGGGGRPSGPDQGGGTRASGGGGKLIAIVIAIIVALGGGGGLLSNFLGGGGDIPAVTSPSLPTSLSELLGGFSGGGAVSTGWTSKSNTGKLDETVASGARAKYTTVKGSGRDTVTLMVYMCGADLETKNGMASADIREMLGADLSDKVNLLIYTGGAKEWHDSRVSSTNNQIHKIENKKLVTLVKNDGKDPMTKSSTLANFIKYCADNYPANRYQLILWDHGGGSVSGYGYDEKNASAGSMTLKGINDALRSGGVKFDFVGFDTCLMATIENALMLDSYADYLVASEETEPGCGWYYTNWLGELSKNTSIPTVKLGRNIIDDFVDFCAQKCSGQKATLSIIDLAELSATVPSKLKDFSVSTSDLIENNGYKQVSDARSDAREFASSSKIDQIDLVHLAYNLGTKESNALAAALLGAVKYNRTSSNMTNAYGVSAYFPYRKTSSVNSSIAACEAANMDSEYLDCIRSFAAVGSTGQTASAGNSPISSILGMVSGGGSGIDVTSLLSGLIGGRSLDISKAANYINEHQFDDSALVWVRSEGKNVIKLSPEQWSLVHDLELNVFFDDGTGYIDLGLDNVYDFTEKGELVGEYDGTWLAIDGWPVAYYFLDSVQEGNSYSITGRVPILLNGERANLILVFDSANPYGYIAGVRSDYINGETETVAMELTGLTVGDKIDFVCDYYDYNGNYQNSYLIGEQLTYTGNHVISNVEIDRDKCSAMYMFRDFYGTEYWTPEIP
ncbi:MAG: peptidase C11 [Clostridia bacterium]|nr:peptidase C11 [Clostridia bacterium]